MNEENKSEIVIDIESSPDEAFYAVYAGLKMFIESKQRSRKFRDQEALYISEMEAQSIIYDLEKSNPELSKQSEEWFMKEDSLLTVKEEIKPNKHKNLEHPKEGNYAIIAIGDYVCGWRNGDELFSSDIKDSLMIDSRSDFMDSILERIVERNGFSNVKLIDTGIEIVGTLKANILDFNHWLSIVFYCYGNNEISLRKFGSFNDSVKDLYELIMRRETLGNLKREKGSKVVNVSIEVPKILFKKIEHFEGLPKISLNEEDSFVYHKIIE